MQRCKFLQRFLSRGTILSRTAVISSKAVLARSALSKKTAHDCVVTLEGAAALTPLVNQIILVLSSPRNPEAMPQIVFEKAPEDAVSPVSPTLFIKEHHFIQDRRFIQQGRSI